MLLQLHGFAVWNVIIHISTKNYKCILHTNNYKCILHTYNMIEFRQ